eukprot:TRINITY_DN2646_c0_g1_i11.p1 TRINITY_DN2646_c0_g1~~TRINITY_DN2646_c0_g1_i11.p1  ORF type:complete len:328 (-),score=48.12 TRINITY_DN2646_c0_g1_i11:141-1124(-)
MSMNDPSCCTVLLTGRNKLFEERIKQITNCGSMRFDKYGFKPSGEITTIAFKESFLAEVITSYPGLVHVTVYDDRSRHAEKFSKFLNTTFPRLESQVVLVPSQEMHLHHLAELELVGKMNRKLSSPLTFKGTCSYTAVVLDQSSRCYLRNLVPPVPDWIEHYHHMTICLGELPETGSYNLPAKGTVLGQTVRLEVLAVGKNERVSGVLVQGFSSINPQPHITLSVSPTAKPKDTNSIVDWISFGEPHFVFGTVCEWLVYELEVPEKKKKVKMASKLNVGELIRTHTNLKGRDIGLAIQKIEEWRKEENLDLSVENLDKVIEKIKGLE